MTNMTKHKITGKGMLVVFGYLIAMMIIACLVKLI